MAILNALLASLPAEPAAVRRVLVGLHFTIVCSLGCGLSASLTGDRPHRSHPVQDVGSLQDQPAQALAQRALSEDPLEASIGMAAINSLVHLDTSGAEEINALDVLAREASGKNLALIGHFSFAERLRSLAAQCWIIEKNPQAGDLPEAAAADVLPQADVIAITATAITNHTIDGLLALRPPAAKVMVLGPSTPLSPVLFDHGIDLLSGALVVDEAAALRTIEQGAIFPQVQGVRLLTITRR